MLFGLSSADFFSKLTLSKLFAKIISTASMEFHHPNFKGVCTFRALVKIIAFVNILHEIFLSLVHLNKKAKWPLIAHLILFKAYI